MRLNSPQVWIALCSMIGVLLVGVADMEQTSPGPISSVHVGLEGIDAGRDCSACHGGFFQGMSQACLDCHDEIESDIEAKSGLHGVQPADRTHRCALCHSEHHGAEFALVNAQSFMQAGSEDPKEFDHALIGFEMEGKHLELACIECHENAEAKLLGEGQHRFRGLSQSCAECHEDSHDGALGRSCADCHTQSSFDDHHSKSHDDFFPLIGGHASLDCRECHEQGTDHALEEHMSSVQSPSRRQCLSCHESPPQRRLRGACSRGPRHAARGELCRLPRGRARHLP